MEEGEGVLRVVRHHLPSDRGRWISHNGEEEACGFCLPNTGNHKGREHAIANNLRKVLAPHEKICLNIIFPCSMKRGQKKR